MCHIFIQERRCHEKKPAPSIRRGSVASWVPRCRLDIAPVDICSSTFVVVPSCSRPTSQRSQLTPRPRTADCAAHVSSRQRQLRTWSFQRHGRVYVDRPKKVPQHCVRTHRTVSPVYAAARCATQTKAFTSTGTEAVVCLRRHLHVSFTRHLSSLVGTGEKEDLQHCWAPHTTRSRNASATERWLR